MNEPRVIFAEDEKDIRSTIERLMNSNFPTVPYHTVNNGKELLGYVRKLTSPHSLRLILTDYNMPHVNGVRAAYGIRAMDYKDQIVLMTGAPEADEIKQALQKKAIDEILLKPFERRDFISLIQSAIKNPDRI